MSRPRLLDLYCGAGGAARGYHAAGFDVVGVDLVEQPSYPFEFRRADAIDFLTCGGWIGFDAIHASPPCPAYSSATRDRSRHPDLYGITRDGLERIGLPWVIENVIGAPYRSGVVLCGSMFDLSVGGEWLRRHRNFESSEMMFAPPCDHPTDYPLRPITISGRARVANVTQYGHSRQAPIELQFALMGLPPAIGHRSLVDAIPPAYTEWIGRQLLRGDVR